MSELLREIEEDIRHERLQKLWNQFGAIAVRLSIAIIVGTAAGVTWKYFQHRDEMEHTSQLVQAVQARSSGDTAAALTSLDAVAAEDSAHAAIALLLKAEIQAATKTAGMEDAYRKLSESSADPALTQLGLVLSAKESGKPLPAASQDSAFAPQQNEMRAWQLLKSGKKEEAVSVFLDLAQNEKTPRTLRLRAASAVAYLAPEKAVRNVSPMEE